MKHEQQIKSGDPCSCFICRSRILELVLNVAYQGFIGRCNEKIAQGKMTGEQGDEAVKAHVAGDLKNFEIN